MKSLPEDYVCYKRTPDFDAETIPPGLLRAHNTKAGVWGKIVITKGRLLYRILEPDVQEYTLTPGNSGIVEPETRHEVAPLDDVLFHVEFYRA